MDYKITILLATHNRSHLIGETLDSIVAQTYENWECLIVDDYSTDSTYEVIKQYQEKDSRFFYFSKTTDYKRGLSGTRNQGLDIAQERRAKFIQLFDDDDIMHPRKLELKIKPFYEDDSLDLSICCYRKFYKKKAIEYNLEKAGDKNCNIRTGNLLKSFFLNEINLNSPGPLWKAAVLEKHRFKEDLFYAEEREYYLRILLNEKLKYIAVDKVLFWYRKHSNAITSKFYSDNNIKQKSVEKFRDSFLEEVLKLKNPPFFLLKSYTAQGVKLRKLEYLEKIKSYIYKRKKIFDVKHFFLLMYIIAYRRWKS